MFKLLIISLEGTLRKSLNALMYSSVKIHEMWLCCWCYIATQTENAQYAAKAWTSWSDTYLFMRLVLVTATFSHYLNTKFSKCVILNKICLSPLLINQGQSFWHFISLVIVKLHYTRQSNSWVGILYQQDYIRLSQPDKSREEEN